MRRHLRRAGLVLPLAIVAAGALADDPLPPRWPHGDPSDEEQLMVELMNRARMDPVGEAERVFRDYDCRPVREAVDFYLRIAAGTEYTRRENRDAFRSYPPQPPLAISKPLQRTARDHSFAMIAEDEQSHVLPGELSLYSRIVAAGYDARAVGESIFFRAESVLDAHGSFAIDYGQDVPPGATRPSLGHRESLMNFDGSAPYVETGVSVLDDTSPRTYAGPKVVTIDFAEPTDGSRFVTGVCYEDMDGDGFYDPGEGIEGVRLTSSASAWHAVSSSSGGYSLPVPARAGAIRVRAVGVPGTAGELVGDQTFDVVLAGANVKVDPQPAADAAPPALVRASAAPLLTLPPGVTEAVLVVPAGSDPSAVVGAADLELDLDHPSAGNLRIELVAPDGTTVLLRDGGTSATTLRGTFDDTLAPLGDPGVLAGAPVAGTWRLRVTVPAAAGTGLLRSFGVVLRPAWIRPVAWTRSNLVLSRLVTKDRPDAASDTLALVAELDGAEPVAADAPTEIVLRAADGSGTVLWRADATALAASGRARIRITPQAGGRAGLTLRIDGADLPLLPPEVLVELRAGALVACQTVPLDGGTYRSSLAKSTTPVFLVDRVASRVRGDVRTTDVRGRFSGEISFDGIVEATVGTARGKAAGSRLRNVFGAAGARTGGSVSSLRIVTIDRTTGTFAFRIEGDHDPAPGTVPPAAGETAPARIDVSLRIGRGYFEESVLGTRDATRVRY